MDKKDIMQQVQQALEEVSRRRLACQADRASLAARDALKAFQMRRMTQTHADLLLASESRLAARFFLDDLYGMQDMRKRDADLQRVIPVMGRVLPVRALDTIAQAIALDALSEGLDMAMAEHLGTQFSAADYCRVYREVTSRAVREHQIRLVENVGASLCSVVRHPLIGSTLTMMRGPAKLAGLASLQQFLERGFAAFKGLPAPESFVAIIASRERRLLERLYAGDCAALEMD